MEGEMDGAGSCYGGGDIAGAIFGTLLAVVLVAVLGWWLYKKGYVLKRKGESVGVMIIILEHGAGGIAFREVIRPRKCVVVVMGAGRSHIEW